jgi:methyl-accepting chemotaxis protein
MIPMRVRGKSIRVTLGVQFFLAAIVMGSLAIYMAISTMGSAATAQAAVDRMERVVEASADGGAIAGLADARDALEAARTQGLILAVIVAGIGAGAAAFLTITVARKARRLAYLANRIADTELPRFSDAIRRLADGDLRVTYEVSTDPVEHRPYDEMGDICDAFNAMVCSLREVADAYDDTVRSVRSIVGDTMAASESLRNGSHTLATASGDAADVASRVALSTTEIADGARTQTDVINNLSKNVAHVVTSIGAAGETIRAVAGASSKASASAEAGRCEVDRANTAMAAIKESFNTIRSTVSELDGHSRRVDEIVDLIRAIADQTSLLALNAAIEAARAGEMGRGFAVVATEVKGLAGKAASSTDAIAAIVDEMKASVDETVSAVEGGVGHVDIGTGVVAAAGSALAEIAGWIDATAERIAAIAEATDSIEEASASIQQDTAGIMEVADGNSLTADSVAAASQEAAASAQEVGATAHELSETAAEMEEAISRFRR